MKTLEKLLFRPVHLSDEIGMKADAKESILFSCLANECLSSSSLSSVSLSAMHGQYPCARMGKISLPD